MGVTGKALGSSFGLGKLPASQFDDANDVVSKQLAFGTRLPSVPKRRLRYDYSPIYPSGKWFLWWSFYPSLNL